MILLARETRSALPRITKEMARVWPEVQASITVSVCFITFSRHSDREIEAMERRCWSAGSWKAREMTEEAEVVAFGSASCRREGGGARSEVLESLEFPQESELFFTTNGHDKR